MLRIAVIGPETTTSAFVAAAERLPQVECAAAVAGLDGCDAVACFGSSSEVERLCDAARGGKHLLVDLAALNTAGDVDALEAACRDAGVRLMIAQPLRYLPSVQTVRQVLDAGKLGEPGLLRIHRWVPAGSASASELLLREVEVANWLFGTLPADVYAVSREPAGIMQAHLGFAGGGMALIEVAASLPDGDDYYSLSLIGKDGAAYADDHHNTQLVYGGGAARAERTGQSLLPHAALLSEFATAVATGRVPAVGTECARRALRVSEAARHSSEAGTAMHWQGESYVGRALLPVAVASTGKSADGVGIDGQECPSYKSSMSGSEAGRTFRCAVLSVVKHAYVPRGVASHPRFELAVVTDDAGVPDWAHERNQQFADERGIPYVRGVEEAIERYDVQVAVVSSEAERHCDLSVRAANLGLHVVQDKPMSHSVAECDRAIEACERSGVKFLMWSRNFIPAVLHAREILASGQIGTPRAIHVDFYFSKDSGPPKGSRRPGYPPINWLARQIEAHADGSDGGVGREPMGELKVEGIYPLGYIRMLTGAAVERVYARTAAHFHQANVDNDVEDLASVTLEMQGGLVGSLCIGRIGAASHPDIGEIKLHVIGTKGGLVLSEARPEVAVYYRDQPPLEFRHRRVAVDNDYQLMQNFAEAIDGGGETILDARASRAICATVDAAVRSGKSGRPEMVAHLKSTL